MVHENKGNPRNYLREKEQSTTKRGSCDQEDDGDEEEKYLLLDQIERAWIVRPTKPWTRGKEEIASSSSGLRIRDRINGEWNGDTRQAGPTEPVPVPAPKLIANFVFDATRLRVG